MSAVLDEIVQTTARPGASVSKTWMRALELTTPIPRQRERVLPVVVDELGASVGRQAGACCPTASASPTSNSPDAHGGTPAGRSHRAWPRGTWSPF